MTYKDKGSYESSPPYNVCARLVLTTLSCHVCTLTSHVPDIFWCAWVMIPIMCVWDLILIPCRVTCAHWRVTSLTSSDVCESWSRASADFSCSVLQCVWDFISIPCRVMHAHWRVISHVSADFSCSVLQCVAVCCSVSETSSQYPVVSRTHIDESYRVCLLISVAVGCSVLQCVAVCVRLHLNTLSCHARTRDMTRVWLATYCNW